MPAKYFSSRALSTFVKAFTQAEECWHSVRGEQRYCFASVCWAEVGLNSMDLERRKPCRSYTWAGRLADSDFIHEIICALKSS